MEYQLTEVTKYAVNCEGCDVGTGNHTQPETANKAAKAKGFIAIATPEDGTINLCPACVPPAVAKLFTTSIDNAKPTEVPDTVENAKADDDDADDEHSQGSLIEGEE